MEVFESLQYERCMSIADRFVKKAEEKYLSGNLQDAVRDYYHASTMYEQAKELASEALVLDKKLDAWEKEYYCQEKLDELKRFKNVSTSEVIK